MFWKTSWGVGVLCCFVLLNSEQLNFLNDLAHYAAVIDDALAVGVQIQQFSHRSLTMDM